MQVVEYFSHLSLECISRRFFFYIQSSVLHRAIWATWSFSHNKEVARLKEMKASGEKVALAGDGRYDSVGEVNIKRNHEIALSTDATRIIFSLLILLQKK